MVVDGIKILFLDMDGVLAIPNNDGKRWGLTEETQDFLGYVIKKTNCYLVISSSWRLHDVEETIQHLNKKGFRYSDRIIGVTIRAYHYLQKGIQLPPLSIHRGVEIKQWIDAKVHSNDGKDYDRKIVGIDYTYCIVDDDIDMLFDQFRFYVNTDSCIGLTKEHANKIISILNNKKNIYYWLNIINNISTILKIR